MKDLIKLISRDGDISYLERFPKGNDFKSSSYILKTNAPYLRTGKTANEGFFIDPSGGPMIVVGSTLFEAKAVVKSIEFMDDVGWIITFKK